MAQSAYLLGLVVVSLMSNVRVDLMAYLFPRFAGRHGRSYLDRYWAVLLCWPFSFWQWRNLLSMTIVVRILPCRWREVTAREAAIDAGNGVNYRRSDAGRSADHYVATDYPRRNRRVASARTPEQAGVAVGVGMIAVTGGLTFAFMIPTGRAIRSAVCRATVYLQYDESRQVACVARWRCATGLQKSPTV